MIPVDHSTTGMKIESSVLVGPVSPVVFSQSSLSKSIHLLINEIIINEIPISRESANPSPVTQESGLEQCCSSSP